jgi:hypothetical protein
MRRYLLVLDRDLDRDLVAAGEQSSPASRVGRRLTVFPPGAPARRSAAVT